MDGVKEAQSNEQRCGGRGQVIERSGGSGWGDGGPDIREELVDCPGCDDCCAHEYQPIDSSGQRACLYCNRREVITALDGVTK
jgi:hypothetical protein